MTDNPHKAIYIIRLRQISTGTEADSLLFRGTENQAREYAEAVTASDADIEVVSVRDRASRTGG